MKTILCGLMLGTLPMLSQVGGGRTVAFAVYAQFEHEPSVPLINSLKQELASILSPAGLRFEWRLIDAPRNGETFPELAVVTFKGTCDICDLIPELAETGALGWTHITDGHVLPFTEVDCDRIRKFLSRELIRQWPEYRDEAFGRAAARVLAHELYHVFLQTQRHGSSGVAKAVYTVRDLIADNLWFAEDDERALAALPVAVRSRGGSSASRVGRSLFIKDGCARCHGAYGEGTRRGPSLRTAGGLFESGRLAAKLTSRPSEMYRRAKGLRIHWPTFRKTEVKSLVAYLNTALE